jgi:oligopeptide/dipeptide ABC transporter ATP-binding protein
MSALLEVQGLQVGYPQRKKTDVAAVRGVSFSLTSGEILGVIGESGSGKSSLASALIALMRGNGKISGGTVALNGENLLEKNSETLREVRGARIAMVLQEPALALHPTKKIGQQVEEVLRAHTQIKREERRSRVQEALRAVFGDEADQMAGRYPHEMSGGQKQRAVIAQAIVCRPPVIVADECTAALDTVTQRGILELFRDLRKKLGMAMVFITHNPALLTGFADRVMVLYLGRVVEMGRTEDVLRSPRHPYTKLLLQCAPKLGDPGAEPARRLPTIPAGDREISVIDAGCSFAPRCPQKMEICERQNPPVTLEGNAHEAACFLYSS